MRHPSAPPLLLIAVVLLGGAWPFGRRAPEPEPEPAPPPEAPSPPPPGLDALFPDPLPFELGPLPEGLANASAQGCHACHDRAHDTWAAGAHGSGVPSGAFARAVEQVGSPACTSCHLPLAVQHAERVAFDEGRVDRPVTAPNPSYSATLHTEGVTCAACHVREGRVVTAEPVEGAPHPTVHSPELTASAGCATCHQLTWPGAEQPIYDTFGEWQRSAYAQAGIGCVDCHGRPGLGERGFSHGPPSDPARAVSLLVDLDAGLVRRGGDPVTVDLTLQNTGAGHHVPTGSPWRRLRLEAALVVVGDDGVEHVHGAPFVTELGRTLGDSPPWRTTDDTRLPAGGSRSWTARLPLDVTAPAGDWSLRVRLGEVVLDEPAPPFVERRVPLRVD